MGKESGGQMCILAVSTKECSAHLHKSSAKPFEVAATSYNVRPLTPAFHLLYEFGVCIFPIITCLHRQCSNQGAIETPMECTLYF